MSFKERDYNQCAKMIQWVAKRKHVNITKKQVYEYSSVSIGNNNFLSKLLKQLGGNTYKTLGGLPTFRRLSRSKADNDSMRYYIKSTRENIDHVPHAKDKRHFVGYEFEVEYPFETETECSNCGGSGETTQECDMGHEHDVECVECEGTGYVSNDETTNERAIEELFETLQELNICWISVDTDSSIKPRSGYAGLEIKLMTLQGDTKKVELVLKELKRLGCLITNKCGLHINFDQRDILGLSRSDQNSRYEAAVKFARLIVEPHRRGDGAYNSKDSSSNTSNKHRETNISGSQRIEVRNCHMTFDSTFVGFYSNLVHTLANRENILDKTDFPYILNRVDYLGGVLNKEDFAIFLEYFARNGDDLYLKYRAKLNEVSKEEA